MSQTRRLAAILAADVTGYSRLMSADEEGTHERLKARRREVVDPKIREHSGRIVKNTGDGLLAEFPSVGLVGPHPENALRRLYLVAGTPPRNKGARDGSVEEVPRR
jgi:class 3 adenylate cyclase